MELLWDLLKGERRVSFLTVCWRVEAGKTGGRGAI